LSEQPINLENDGKFKKKDVKDSKRLNDLDGKTWTRYSISVWNIAKSPQEMKLRHPAMFPEELVKRLITIYTKKGDTVLDAFMGSGSTILVAKNLSRKGIGFEISKDFVKLAKKRLSQQLLFSPNDEEEPLVYEDDARNLLNYLEPDSIDLVITSPPYWNILRQKRTADYKEKRPYTDLPNDLGNIDDYDSFVLELQHIFQNVLAVLKPEKHCIIIVMDLRKKNKFYPLHIDIAKMMMGIGFEFEDIIIWDRKQEYSNLRPLGYPYVFRVNKVHEYILIFKKIC